MPTNLKKYSANNTELTAAGGAYTWTITKATHGINTPVVVQLYEVATNEMVMADVVVAPNGDVTIKIVGSGTLAADKYKVVIIG